MSSRVWMAAADEELKAKEIKGEESDLEIISTDGKNNCHGNYRGFNLKILGPPTVLSDTTVHAVTCAKTY